MGTGTGSGASTSATGAGEPKVHAAELRTVHKGTGGSIKLVPTDLIVPRGATLVLLGPTGGGKSLIFGLLAGLVAPDGGLVLHGGQAVKTEDPETRRRIGIVPQDAVLFPHLTVAGNAALVSRWLGASIERVEARLLELAQMLRLDDDALATYPAALAPALRPRALLLRALMLDPPLLLLDEPFAGLDPQSRASLQDEVHLLFRHLGKSVVLATSDLALAAHLGDLVAFVAGGRVLQVGPLAELDERPHDNTVTRFLGAQRRLWQLGGAS